MSIMARLAGSAPGCLCLAVPWGLALAAQASAEALATGHVRAFGGGVELSFR